MEEADPKEEVQQETPEVAVEKVTKTKPSKKADKRNLSNRIKAIARTRAFAVVVVVIIALSPAAYFYHKSKQAEKLLNDPNTANQQVINEVVKKVSRHILLPTGEQPTLASVTDVNKVKSQPFFANAQNGDKVLVYTQARKAYLYRPDKDIIVEVAPLNVGKL